MSQPQDFRPRKNAADLDLAATVPDILSPGATRKRVSAESTTIQMTPCGRMNFPGKWESCDIKTAPILLLNCDSSAAHYREENGLSALLSVGGCGLGERTEMLISKFSELGAHALHDYELSALHASLSESRPATDYEVDAGSLEKLGGHLLIVLQGYFKQSRMKEALIIFSSAAGYGHFSLRAIKPEFPIYFDLLRSALSSFEWD